MIVAYYLSFSSWFPINFRVESSTHNIRLRLEEERRLKSEYESERGSLEQQYKERLDQIRSELEEEEAMQKRNMLKATDALVAEYKKQMEVGKCG